MGQQIGKASYISQAATFLNLSKRDIEALWDAFNDVAEGFGLSPDEFRTICVRADLAASLRLTQEQLEQRALAIFRAFDTDSNDLVDALEFLATFALASGMTLEEKIHFTFELYDFDQSNELTIDEMTLSLKSTITGLAKISGVDPPNEVELELLANDAFTRADKDHDQRITKEQFALYCRRNPEVRSWVEYYDDPPDPGAGRPDERHLAVEGEPAVVDSSALRTIARNPERAADQVQALEAAAAQDKFFAVKPWVATAASTEPSYPPPLDATRPDDGIDLEWVHGYSGATGRGNLFYTRTGNAVFPAATLGVVQRRDPRRQAFFGEHAEAVTALAVRCLPSREQTLVATGEGGSDPRIALWDAESMRSLATIRGAHSAGVARLAISDSGALLASVGSDRDHTLVIHALEQGADCTLTARRLFSAPTSRRKVLDCAFLTEDRLITCGVGHVFFWSRDEEGGGGFEVKQGIFGRVSAREAIFSAAPHPDGSGDAVTGTASGRLLIWRGRNCMKAVEAHKGPVVSLSPRPGTGLASGGRDGFVRLWNTELEQGGSFHVGGFEPFDAALAAVCWDSSNGRILVGTRGCEVYELSDGDGSDLHGGPLVQGHCSGELHGLAAHPEGREYCTVGDDRTLRVWDAASHRMVRMLPLDTAARATAYSPDGSLLVVGFGAGAGPANSAAAARALGDGGVALLDGDSLEPIVMHHDAKGSIRALRFNPEGSTLAAAVNDSGIYLYNALAEGAPIRARASSHTAAVGFADFSSDGRWLQSSCDGYELRFHDATTGEPQEHAAQLKDVEWASWTLPLGWPVQGVWPRVADGTQITAVSRSSNGRLLVTGDTYGRVSAWRFPCVDRASRSARLLAHADGVGAVTFLPDDSRLVTVGAVDRCVMQWRVRWDAADDEAEEAEVPPLDQVADPADRCDLDDSAATVPDRTRCRALARDPAEESARFAMQAGAGTVAPPPESQPGPWLRAAVPPSKPAPENTSPPEAVVAPQWVHGYRGHDTRNSVSYALGGAAIAFPAASLGVVMRADQGSEPSQRFFAGHCDDVLALAVSPCGRYVATGEAGAVPRICVWDAATCTLLSTLRGFHRRAVRHIAFSPNGRFIASVGSDAHHSVALHDWRAASLVASAEGEAATPMGLVFLRDPDEAASGGSGGDGKEEGEGKGEGKSASGAEERARQERESRALGDAACFAVTAVKAVYLWRQNGRSMWSVRGVIGRRGRIQPFPAAAALKGELVAGTRDGFLYRFAGRCLAEAVPAHQGSVLAARAAPGRGLVTGGADRCVRLWSEDLEQEATFDLTQLPQPPRMGEVRSVCWDADSRRILVGTRGCEVYELSDGDGSDLHGGPLVQGHCSGELHGLAAHPEGREYCTVGDDRTLRVWDAASHKLLARSEALPTAARAVAYSPDGKHLAVGFGAGGGGGEKGKRRQRESGAWTVVDRAQPSEQVHFAQDASEPVTALRYAPNGATLAVATADGVVSLYDVRNGYNRRGSFPVGDAAPTALDFSSDCRALQVATAAGELLYCDAATGERIANETTTRDTEWASWTLPIGWPVKGAWSPAGVSPAHPVSAARSPDGALVAVAGSEGAVSVRHWPCLTPAAAGALALHGHASAPPSVAWLSTTEGEGGAATRVPCGLVTAGGADGVAISWRVSPPRPAVARTAPKAEPDAERVFGGAEASAAEAAAAEPPRPWVAAVVPPSSGAEDDSSPPAQVLEPEHVYGLRAADTRGAVRYTRRGVLAFPAGATACLYQKTAHKQRLCAGHKAPLLALAVSPCGRFLATGDEAALASVCVWDADSGTLLCTLPPVLRGGVRCLSFSADSSALAALGAGAGKSCLALWATEGGWAEASLVAVADAGAEEEELAFVCAWDGPRGSAGGEEDETASPSSPRGGPGASVGPLTAVTGGATPPRFWRLAAGRLLSSVRCDFGDRARPQELLCAARQGARVLTGGKSGNLFAWRTTGLDDSKKGHEGSIDALHVSHSGQVITGGSDALVRLWTPALVVTASFDMRRARPAPLAAGVRSVDLFEPLGTVLAATEGGDVYEVARETETVSLVLQGHSSGLLTGLAAHPTHPNVFATAGGDGTVRVWHAGTRRLLRRAQLGGPVRCVAWSQSGDLLAVGFGAAPGEEAHPKDGAFAVLHAGELSHLHEGRPSKQAIDAIAFAPDGACLAVASRDANLYLHDAKRGFELSVVCDKHSHGVTALDFTDDGRHLRSTCSGGELLFFSASDGAHVASPSTLKDAQWATKTVPVGWEVQGAWPAVGEGGPGSAPRAADVAPNPPLAAVGTGQGEVRLYRAPCVSRDAAAFSAKMHPSPVGALRFVRDGSTLVTVGEGDRTVVQWRVARPEELEE